MRLDGSQLVIALDAGGVCGARVTSGIGGLRCRGFTRRPLAAGALVPHGVEPNVRSDEVKDALAGVAEDLGGRRVACLVLPAGTARTREIVDLPAGTDVRDYARFRLAPSLPYPAAEAVVDVIEVGASRWLAAAMRRSVVEDYEAAVEAAGLSSQRLDFAPFAALQALDRVASAETSIDVLLGDAAVSIAARHRGGCVAFRSRLRDPGPGEGRWLAAEIERTARLADVPHSEVRLVGAGAAGMAGILASFGRPATAVGAPWAEGLPLDAEGAPWLGALLS